MVLATAAAVLVQDAALGAQLDRIAWSQIVMASGMIVVTLTILASGVAAFLLFRSVRKLIRAVEAQARALAPRAEPLLTAASKVASDATGVSGAVKERVDEVLQTVQELNVRMRELAAETETRVRDFGAVLDVIQAETRELLLDAAATARGVHATAEALQAGRARGPARRGE